MRGSARKRSQVACKNTGPTSVGTRTTADKLRPSPARWPRCAGGRDPRRSRRSTRPPRRATARRTSPAGVERQRVAADVRPTAPAHGVQHPRLPGCLDRVAARPGLSPHCRAEHSRTSSPCPSVEIVPDVWVVFRGQKATRNVRDYPTPTEVPARREARVASPRDGRDPSGVRQVVVMGVSGVGKTTVAKGISTFLGGPSPRATRSTPRPTSRDAAGTPLTDDDRWPWLRTSATG